MEMADEMPLKLSPVLPDKGSGNKSVNVNFATSTTPSRSAILSIAES